MRNVQIIVLGVCIAVATIVSSLIFAGGFMRVMKFRSEVVEVTGSAQQEIRSDLAVWDGRLSRRGTELAAPYKMLKEDLGKVKAYLGAQGVKEKEIEVFQVHTETLYKKDKDGENTNVIEGYLLSQTVEVRSTDVERVGKVSRESTDLIEQGVEFVSETPSYFYTKLNELKVEMLARASENAKARADSMAKSTGSRVKMMQSAHMGVFQITPVDSTEVSGYGVNDTSALVKKVTAVVTMTFALE